MNNNYTIINNPRIMNKINLDKLMNNNYLIVKHKQKK